MRKASHLLMLLAATGLTLNACTYREIRPDIATQEAAIASEIIKFGPVSFQQLAPNVWQHTSYLDLPGFGAVPSNGLLVIDGNSTVLVDTAWTVPQTNAIIAWAASELDRPIRAAIVTHAHSDKMGGIDALHNAGVETYAHPMTNRIAPNKKLTPAKNALRFNADGWAANPVNGPLGILQIYYPGPGHTDDNITVAVKETDIAFGGCLIKASDAKSLGNLAEADTDQYAKSVQNFADAFSGASTIAMSHSAAEDRSAIKRTLKLANDL